MESVESAMEKGMAGSSNATPIHLPGSTTLRPDRSFSGNTKVSEKSLKDGQKAAPGESGGSWRSWRLPSRLRRQKNKVDVRVRRLNDCPRGYPNLAAFLDSDEGFTIYRRFGYIQSRLLLNKQEELRRLELKLDKMDHCIAKGDSEGLCSYDTKGDSGKKHKKLLAEIETKFCSYASLLAVGQQMMALKRPAEAEYNSVGRYMFNRRPLVKAEGTWIEPKEDLITLRASREHAWLDGIVENFLRIAHCRLIDWVFRSDETRRKTEIDSNTTMAAQPPDNEQKYEIYYTRSRITKLANGILTFLILALLVLPIYVLYHMVHDVGTKKAYTTCIGTLLVFTLAFSAVLCLFTKAKRHEILAAAAAYCAVLVVFLGNVSPKIDFRNGFLGFPVHYYARYRRNDRRKSSFASGSEPAGSNPASPNPI